MPTAAVLITKKEFNDRIDTASGICISCLAWNDEHVPPDVDGFKCEHCKLDEVAGIREAVRLGVVEVKED